MQDLLTIALPVYKRVDYIKSALDSAFNQTVKCRILLIDNNSPHQEFKEIVESYNSPLFEYVRMETTVPQDENFNNCFKYTKTPWLTILHDDDMLHCQFVELAQKILANYGNSIGGYAVRSEVGEIEWDGIGQKVDLPEKYKVVREPYFYFHHLTPFPGVVVRRDAALDLKGFNAPLHPISDFDFWYRLSKSYKVLFVDQKFAYYRTSPSQSTNTLVENMIKNLYLYRKNLIAKGSHNNYLTSIAFHDSVIENINYFSHNYQNFKIDYNVFDSGALKRTKRLSKIPGMKRFLNFYKNSISFD